MGISTKNRAYNYEGTLHFFPLTLHYKGGTMPWKEILIAVGSVMITIAHELKK